MANTKGKLQILRRSHLQVMGVILILLLAVLLLWHGNTNSRQAVSALMA